MAITAPLVEWTTDVGELPSARSRAPGSSCLADLFDDGVRPGQIVGLFLPRGIDLLVMQLAIAKAGTAWLPSDPDTPVERIASCLDDALAAGIVSCNEFAPLPETR